MQFETKIGHAYRGYGGVANFLLPTSPPNSNQYPCFGSNFTKSGVLVYFRHLK